MVRRCPKALDGVYWRAVNSYADWRDFGAFPMGARSIQDIPDWLFKAWKIIHAVAEEAKHAPAKKEQEKMEQAGRDAARKLKRAR